MSKVIFMSERKLLMIILAACFLSIFLAANASAGKILFTSDRDGNNDIYVMNADGSGVSQLTNGPGDNWDPA
jgi:hypothetical protein